MIFFFLLLPIAVSNGHCPLMCIVLKHVLKPNSIQIELGLMISTDQRGLEQSRSVLKFKFF